MSSWLERLQEKPKAQRQRIAFFWALSLTSIIVVVWLVSLPERLGSVSQSLEEPEFVPTSSSNSFMEGVREQIAGVREAVTQAGDAVVNQPEPEPASEPLPATTTATSGPAIIMPDLSQSENRPSRVRPILIATTSATTT
jgi:hypothetical protein